MLSGDLKFLQLDLKGAIDQWKAALLTYESVNEWGTATNVIWWLIDAYLQLGDFQKVFDYCAEMTEIYMQHGLRIFAVGVLSKESLEKSRYGDLAEAMQIRRRCIDIIHETGPEYQFAWNYWEMGELVRLSGDLAGAAGWFERSGKIFEREQDNVGLSFYHRGMGDVAIARGDFEGAHRCFMDSVRHSQTANHTWMIAYAEQSRGRAELRLGQQALAEKHILKALKLAVNSRDQGIILVVLAAYAELLTQQRQLERAIQLASVVHGHFLTWHEIRKRAGDLLAVLRKSAPRSKYTKAEKRGRSTDLWKLVETLM
jgi:tetratricopeptide (TPR) repeat protein